MARTGETAAAPEKVLLEVKQRMERWREENPDGVEELRVAAQQDGPPIGAPVEARIQGSDYATNKAIANSNLLSGILGETPPFTTVFPDSDLGQQLRMIAWLIHVAPQLGLNRQVFFANLWGWDLHDSQVDLNNTTNGAHAELLGDLSASLSAFQAAMVELGHQDQVTTFTASDFGRTYNTNGDGSDHGWGNHQIIMGGAVQGGNIYGTMPDLTIDGPNDTGRGRWIPTTSVDEYSATLARWFGVSQSDLPLVLPNIGRFANPNLGFMV